MLDPTLIQSIFQGGPPERIRLFSLPLIQAMEEFSIETPLQQAHFLAQVAHESGCLRWLEEIWGPTPAQLTYEGRRDLGNTQPGDGYRFRGFGPIQITGRANVTQLARALREPSLLQPTFSRSFCSILCFPSIYSTDTGLQRSSLNSSYYTFLGLVLDSDG